MNSLSEIRSLLVTSVLLACSLSSFAQYEERIDTALLRKNGFRKMTVRIAYPFDEIEGRPGRTSMEITYDNRGRKLSTYSPSSDATGNLTTFTYDEKGRLTGQKGVFGDADSNRVAYHYDAEGNMTGFDLFYKGYPTETWHYGYDGNRNKLWEVRLSSSGDTVSRYDYFYKNNRLDKERYSAHRQFKCEYTYLYDAHGYETGKKRTDGTMDLLFPAREYNDNGELVKEFYFGNENGKREVVQTRYNTWENGQLVRERIVYPDGKEMVSTVNSYYPNGLIREIRSQSGQQNNVYEEQYVYGPDHRLARKLHLTGGNEQYCAYSYDPFGNLTSEQLYYGNALQTSRTFTYDNKGRCISAQAVQQRIPDLYHESVYGTGTRDTLIETYLYAADTQRVATYVTGRFAVLPDCYTRFGRRQEMIELTTTDKRRRRPELYTGTYLDSVQLISRTVTSGDTLSRYHIGVFRKHPAQDHAHFLGFITRVETRQNGIRAFTDTDGSGRVLSEAVFANDVYTIRYLKEFYVRNGNTGVLYTCSAVYTGDTLRNDVYDAAGRPVSHTYAYERGTPSNTFAYDTAGRLIRMTERFSAPMIYTTDYTYDANGLLQTEIRYDHNGAISCKKQFVYAGGKLKRMESEMPGTQLVYRFSYE